MIRDPRKICLKTTDILMSYVRQKYSGDAEGAADVTGLVDVQDVTGTLEIHYQSSQECKNKKKADSLPTTNRKI
jgi:hypothetical protein